jgi:N-acetylmuramoyl-L-alanine amidase
MRSIREAREDSIRLSSLLPREHDSHEAIPLRFAPGLVACGVLLCAGLMLSAAGPEKKLAVFSASANFSVPIVQRKGQDYLGLLELLDPLGSVSAKSTSSRWYLRFNNILGEFTEGSSRSRIQGREAALTGNFLLENGRGLVPLASLTSLLPRFLGASAALREESNRLFIGNIATHFTASIATDDPSQLVFHFTAPVNPSLASEPGTLRMIFRREPITAPASPMLTFGSKIIPSADYSENNGAAEISVSTTIPLTASFSSDGRTITLTPSSTANSHTSPKAPANPAPAAKPAPGPASAATVQPASTTSAASLPRRYFAIVDASHGGGDRGEALSPTLAEKDVTAAFARRLRQELESRGIPTFVLRDSDANVSLDDRAFFTNSTHAAVYLALHAASNGHGVRLYTSLLPSADQQDSGPFRSWSTAQSSFLPISQATAASVAAELRKLQVTVRNLSAPLRPLNNIVTAAIAVEVAPPTSDLSPLTAPDYQQLVAGAVANGIVAIHSQLEAAP